jgi:hypothetical protein
MKTMKNTFAQPGQSHQRKIKYIDHVMQKWLLIALVVLEMIVLSVAGVILYTRLNTIVDESLYRIHFGGQPSMFSVLLAESLRILGGLVVVNLLALFVADRIWAHYVRGILAGLCCLFERTRELDFGADPEMPIRHKIIALALQWRCAERARQLALQQSLALMATQCIESEAAFCASLLAFREHLPQADI